jgi:methylated-DNA-[protein]-cysteine S-methyltransferase
MTTLSFATFGTALGECGIAWGEGGIVAVRTPEAGDKVRARLLKRFPSAREQAPPPEVARVIADIVAVMSGEARDLTYAALDMRAIPDFNRKVYAVAQDIPFGKTLTYGEVAARLGDKLLAREVGQALGQNPFPIVVPCHRVLAASGKSGHIKVGGFSAPGGVTTKMRMLTVERAQPGGPTLFGDLPLAARPRQG